MSGDHSRDDVPPSENDYSIGVRLSYGGYAYATAGDNDGEYNAATWGYGYNDIEAMGRVETLRANHLAQGWVDDFRLRGQLRLVGDEAPDCTSVIGSTSVPGGTLVTVRQMRGSQVLVETVAEPFGAWRSTISRSCRRRARTAARTRRVSAISTDPRFAIRAPRG